MHTQSDIACARAPSPLRAAAGRGQTRLPSLVRAISFLQSTDFRLSVKLLTAAARSVSSSAACGRGENVVDSTKRARA